MNSNCIQLFPEPEPKPVTFEAWIKTLTPEQVLLRLNQGLWSSQPRIVILSIINGLVDQDALLDMEDEAGIKDVRLGYDDQDQLHHVLIYTNPSCTRDVLEFLDFCYSGEVGRLVLASRCPMCGAWALCPTFCSQQCRERFTRERQVGVVNLFANWAPS